MGQIKVKSVNVKLGVADDLNKAVSTLNEQTQKISNATKSVAEFISRLKQETSNAVSTRAEQFKFINQAEAAAKELGINVNSVPGYKEAMKAQDILQKAIVVANQVK